MAFVKLAGAADVRPGSMVRVEHDGREVLLANVEGAVYAVAERCTHRGGSLSKGTIADGVVTCPRHESRFDVRTGKNVERPRILGIRGSADDLRVYEVRLEGDDVLVDLG